MGRRQINPEEYTRIAVERKGRVLTLTLNRPEKLNAIDGAMHSELVRAFRETDEDPESDIIVLTGQGPAFSAGGDVDWLQSLAEEPSRFDEVAADAKRIVFTLLQCEKPIIAKVNGHSAGLGTTVALFCDVIFASSEAQIGDPHVVFGLVAGDGGAIIWPQLIGYARAKEFLLTGEMIPAPRAAELGLINHAVPPNELDATVDAFVERLASGATKAIRWTKVSVNIGLRHVAQQIMDASISLEAQSNLTGDHLEALRAFREKRAPRFRGR